jgi:hypothetical protein
VQLLPQAKHPWIRHVHGKAKKNSRL